MANCQRNEDVHISWQCREGPAEIMRISQPVRGRGFLTRYIPESKTLINKPHFRRVVIGEENSRNLHKTILIIGATGTGVSSLINAMVNYMLGVEFDDRIWVELIETKENQTVSQTNIVTVYDINIKNSPISLTVIDTPGFGNTGGIEEDFRITETLHELFTSKDGVQEIDLVCLVVSAANFRLTQTQLYVFDRILSLFGKDVENNIVVLMTHATRKPINAIEAIKESRIKYAKTADGEPVYFRFDNSHCEALFEKYEDEEEYASEHKASWDLLEKSMGSLFDFMNKIQAVSVTLTAEVPRIHKQLLDCITHLKNQITETEKRKCELEQVKVALKKHEMEKQNIKDFEYEVDESYKEKVPIESAWWWWSKEATCCSVCEENCHYPGCWWVRNLKWCSAMSRGKCTVCTGRCDHTHHVKERKMYVVKTRKVKRTYEDLKVKYETESGMKMSLISRLENELKVQEIKETRLVEECYECVVTLDRIALKTDRVLQHLDFLIPKLNEIGKNENAKELEELKKRYYPESGDLLQLIVQYINSFWTSRHEPLVDSDAHS